MKKYSIFLICIMIAAVCCGCAAKTATNGNAEKSSISASDSSETSTEKGKKSNKDKKSEGTTLEKATGSEMEAGVVTIPDSERPDGKNNTTQSQKNGDKETTADGDEDEQSHETPIIPIG